MFSVCVYLYSLTTGGNDTYMCGTTNHVGVTVQLTAAGPLPDAYHVRYKHGTHHDTAVSVRGTVLVDT